MIPETNYLRRYLYYFPRNHFRQTTDDFHFFASKDVEKSNEIFQFGKKTGEERFQELPDNFNIDGFASIDDLMNKSNTTALIIIKDDVILHEMYYNSFHRDSLSRIFSASKSFLSALIGIALEERLIESIDDPIQKYIPEIRNARTGSLTIKNLLMMHSGIGYKEGKFPWSDDIKVYFAPDMRSVSAKLDVKDKAGEFFHYNDYYPQLLTMILERVTNKSTAEYFGEKLWKQIGTEFPAKIVVDSSKCGFEKMESGICARAIDLAKFGRLFLGRGMWNGKRIISEEWIDESTSIDNTNTKINYFKYYNHHQWGRWLSSGKAFYKYFWWGYKTEEDQNDYFAMGVLGQIIYISPRKNAIAVRLGKDWGINGWWPTILKGIIDSVQ